MEKVKIKLRNGLVVEGDKFDMEDYKKLKEIFLLYLPLISLILFQFYKAY